MERFLLTIYAISLSFLTQSTFQTLKLSMDTLEHLISKFFLNVQMKAATSEQEEIAGWKG